MMEYDGVGKATKPIQINTESSIFRLKQTCVSCLPTVLVKNSIPVSTICSPGVAGGSSLSLYEALTQLLCWAMPLEACWGYTSHEARLEESTACIFLQCWRSIWSPLCVLVAGELLSSGVQYQTDYITISAPRAQHRKLMVKLYPLHPSTTWVCIRILSKERRSVEGVCISYFLLLVVYRLYCQVVCVRF